MARLRSEQTKIRKVILSHEEFILIQKGLDEIDISKLSDDMVETLENLREDLEV